MFDGKDFVMSQAFEGGVGLGQFTQGTGNTVKYSDLILGFRRKFEGTTTFTRVGGIAKTKTGYVHVLVHGKGGANYYPSEGMPHEPVPITLGFAPADFEKLPLFKWSSDWKPSALERGVSEKTLATPSNGFNFVRPKLLDLKNGQYLVLWEQRVNTDANRDKYDCTKAVVIDDTGAIVKGPVSLQNAPTQMCNDAIYLPKTQQAAWVSGDATAGKMMLYVLDRDLKLQSHSLSIP
jgi:hypothetical protein